MSIMIIFGSDSFGDFSAREQHINEVNRAKARPDIFVLNKSHEHLLSGSGRWMLMLVFERVFRLNVYAYAHKTQNVPGVSL